MPLAAYKKKRNFTKTPEPKGITGPRHPHALHYLIQKHNASRLHYDFRLELDGTLKSWAVPKGPSLDPNRKALAVQVEDHPMDYEDFEGVIPKGQYGGGTVMLWDKGTWEPLDDPHTGFKKGHLRFKLHGEKLKGAWSLVQMHGPAGENGKNWLLIKAKDDHASTQEDILNEDKSVKSKRSLDQIADQRDHVWNSKSAAVIEPPSAAHKSPMPTRIFPQLARLADHPPAGDDWLHEIKFDGYRLIAFLKNGQVTLRTRTGEDWTHKFELLVPPLTKLPADTAILDGEIVALNPQGKSDFELLQQSFKSKDKSNLHYYLFDLLYLNGSDLRNAPLLERKESLKSLLEKIRTPILEYSDHVQGHGEDVIARACAIGSEGIISKRADAPYTSRRDPTWIKSKCTQGQEFIIIGYTRSDKRKGDLRSLLLGVYDPEHGLVYSGRVGTGFDSDMRRGLLAKLKPLEQEEPPTDIPPPVREQRNAVWVKPKLVCEVHFTGWTKDNVLRHPSFLALRLDKPAKEVIREKPTNAPKAATKSVHTTNGRSHSKMKPSTNGHAPKTSTTQWAGITLTHPDKLLYPTEKLTKADLANYYELAQQFMLPHIIHRPLALIRCPAGLSAKCFFARNHSDTMPPAISKIDIAKEKSRHEYHVMIEDAPGLFSLAQISALEIHTWNCSSGDIEHPDQLVFDLDPAPELPWKRVLEGAQILRDTLTPLGLTPFLKTSGGKGLHLTIPIEPTVAWSKAKSFCKTIAEHLSAEHALFIANMRKDLRKNKIYLDFLRNQRASTAIAPYSTRARAGAAVSMPIAWDDLLHLKSADQFTLKNAAAHLQKRKSDPWQDFNKARVDLHQIVTKTTTKNSKE